MWVGQGGEGRLIWERELGPSEYPMLLNHRHPLCPRTGPPFVTCADLQVT